VVQASPDPQRTPTSKVVVRPAPPRVSCGCTQPICGTCPQSLRASCGPVVRWFQI
jgi:hypothetical protein